MKVIRLKKYQCKSNSWAFNQETQAIPYQIYAHTNSSFAVLKNNDVIFWGSNNEGFICEKQKDINLSKKFQMLDKLKAFIDEDLKKDDDNFTKDFLQSLLLKR